MARIHLLFLGSPRIERDGAPVDVDTRKALALLGYLAQTGESHGRDTLAGLLWPEYSQTNARAALRRTLWSINKALDGVGVRLEQDAVALDPTDDLWIDLLQFQQQWALLRTHGHAADEVCAQCSEPLTAIVKLYRDDFLAGFALRDSPAFDDWQFGEAEGLRRQFGDALHRLARIHAQPGEWEVGVGYARRWLALDQLNEAAYRTLMQLHAWAGQRTAALRQYQKCVDVLAQELDVEPQPETTALYEAIKHGQITAPYTNSQHPAPGMITSSSVEDPSIAPAAADKTASASTAHLFGATAAFPLVGRDIAWAAVRDAYAAIKHDGYVIALEGEAGIGKTRLAEALLAHAQARGATVIHMRCYAGETNLSYGPFVEGLRMVVGQISTCISNAPLAAISEAARLLPDLVRRHPKLPPAPPLDTPGAQLRFFEGVTDVLLAVASDTAPLVLCFDDLHWADAATLDLLTYLARRLGGRLVCLVLTWRQEDVGPTHRLRDLLAELERVHRATTITLQRLDQAAVAVLVEAAAPGEHARDVALRLYQETEGLPLFVIEYLSSLQQSPPTMNNWPLPSGVRNLLHARLRAVDEQLRPVLATAAVIGRSFDFDTLRTASGHNEDDVVTALETLLAHGVIAEVNQPGSSTVTYDFRHDKLRALVYDETSAARRRLIHRRVAEALIAQTQGAAAFAGQIAQHFRLAGQVQQAALYFKLAGDHTRAVYANVDAKTYYETALALGHTDHVVLHEALGDLHTLGGEYSVAICSYEAALSSCSGAACATLQHKLGTVYQRRGAWMQAEHHFEQALRMLDTATAAGEQARILVDRSLIAHQQGRSADAARFAEQALELAASATDARALAQAHNVLGVLRSSAGDYVAAQHHLEHSLGLAGHLADPTLRAAASNNLALVCSAAGDTVRALDLFEAALQLCTALGDRHREAALHNNMADLLHAAGRSDEAITHLKQAVVIYAEIGVEAGAVQPEIWKLVEW